MEVAEWKRIHRLPRVLQTTVSLRPPMSHSQDQTACVASHWLVLNFLKAVPISLGEDRNAKDVILGRQNRGLEHKKGSNGKQEMHKRLAWNGFQRALKRRSRMTFDSLHMREGAVEAPACWGGLCLMVAMSAN